MNTHQTAPLRVKITMASGEVWYATAYPSNQSRERRIAKLNKLATIQNIGSKYEEASEAEYQAYKASQKAYKASQKAPK